MVERAIRAPIEDVFAAMTTPELMARWLSPTGHAEVDADVRVGGRLRVVMLGEGVRIEHTGEYLTVAPPSLLAFTWISAYTGDEPSVVTITLESRSAETWLRLQHERLPLSAGESHRGGWHSIIERLAHLVEA